MKRAHIYRILTGCWVAVMMLVSPALSQTPRMSLTTVVIPPGQEALITKMLTMSDEVTQKTGCDVQKIDVGKAVIEARVVCKTTQGESRWTLALTSVNATAAAGSKIVQTKRFRVTADKGLNSAVFDRLVGQIKAHEAAFRWIAASRGRTRPATDLPSGPKVTGDVANPVYRRYMVGYEMFKKKQHVKAFEYFLAMARDNPTFAGVLGMLVANLAPLQPNAEKVKEFTAAADNNPDSPVDSFLAGVAAHYSAHYKATTIAAKKALYKTAIKYLKRTRPAFDAEPRVFIYLAVSHYRLGHQKVAEGLIEKAVALNRRDPDAFYCRAEIFHRTQPARAIKDIDQYLKLTKAEGGVSSGKVQRVRKMREFLVRVVKGETKMPEMWDPIIGQTQHPYEVPKDAELFINSRKGLMILIGATLLIFLLSFAVYRFRKKPGQDKAS